MPTITCSHAHVMTILTCVLYFVIHILIHVSAIVQFIALTYHATNTSIKLTPAFAELWFGLPSKCRDGAGSRRDGTDSVSVDGMSRGDLILFSHCHVMHVIFIVFLVVYGMYYSIGFDPVFRETCYVSDGSPYLFMQLDPSLSCSVLISGPNRCDRVVDVLMYSEFVGTFMICYLCL